MPNAKATHSSWPAGPCISAKTIVLTIKPYSFILIANVWVLPGMCHTFIWDLHTLTYMLYMKYADNTIVFQQSWECRFLTQNEPDSPQNYPKRFLLFSYILYVTNILYYSIGCPLQGCLGAARLFRGRKLPLENCLKRPKISKIRQTLQSYDTASPICSIRKIRVNYDTTCYTSTAYHTSLTYVQCPPGEGFT